MKKMSVKESQRQEAIKELRKYLTPGETVYTILRHVSGSGMMRHIDVIVLRNNEPRNISYLVSQALGWSIAKHNGIKVTGCAMDMGFHTVYALASAIWPNGDGTYVSGRNGDTTPETDGGYLLKQRWL